jgi:hypothetical protein
MDQRDIHIDASTLERMLRRRDHGVNQMLLDQLDSCPLCREVAAELYERYRGGELGEFPEAELLADVRELPDPPSALAVGD